MVITLAFLLALQTNHYRTSSTSGKEKRVDWKVENTAPAKKESDKGQNETASQQKKREASLRLLWTGTRLKQAGKYDDAMLSFQRFKDEYIGTQIYGPEEEQIYKDKVNRQIESLQWAMKNRNQSEIIVHMEGYVNSQQADFNPFTNAQNQLIFSSRRDIKNGKISRFFSETDSTLDRWNSFTTKKHIANGRFNTSFDEFYFTVCEADSNMNCAIYGSYLDDIGHWSYPQKLDSINEENVSNTTPATAIFNGEEYLVFASNRAGGEGGFDIYKAKHIGKTQFAFPENLNVVNTPEDEFTPFYDTDSNKFYFASAGWNGFGGLDIFSIPADSLNGNTLPKNLGYGINSEADDMGYALSTDLDRAYFSSKRKGALYIKQSICCFDIWNYATGRLRHKDNTLSQDSIRQASEKMLVERIPILLYFDNNEPAACCNRMDTSAVGYDETYQRYHNQLSQYERYYSQGAKITDKAKLENDVLNLFKGKVDFGMTQLGDFSQRLLYVLEHVKKVTIVIKGYSSPLSTNRYNALLSHRRIAAVKNHFVQYQNGVLKNYMDSGKLVLKEFAFGEEKASPKVSDSFDDKRNSVYSPEAALERRVEVITVIVE